MALGLVAVAANLRTVMASVPPLVETIAADLGLSNAAMGALTTLPVLCMGVFAPTAQRLAARIGAAGAVEVAAACLAIGTDRASSATCCGRCMPARSSPVSVSPSGARCSPAWSRSSSPRTARDWSPASTCSR